MRWVDVERPGFFGRRRDEKIAGYNAKYGEGNWRLAWIVVRDPMRPEFSGRLVDEFLSACQHHYEKSYYAYLSQNPGVVDFICGYREVIDNAPTNITSGLDYEKQEAFSTHIQDIAIRNCLRRLGRWFDPKAQDVLVVRGVDSDGHLLNPGHIPYMNPTLITQPSMAPTWAKPGSVEDFWQSNKWLQVRQ